MLTACCCCRPESTLSLDALRRPQVMSRWNPTVLDYNPILEEYSQRLQEAKEECQTPEEKVPLTPEMYKPFKASDDNFYLAKGDLVAVAVFGDDETIVDEASIAPDGKLYYIMMEEGVPAAGRTIPEVRKDIEEAVTKYFVEPVVTLSAKTSTNDTYAILGRVLASGVYSTTDPIRLREAISNAGGLLKEDFTGRNELTSPEQSLADLKNSFIIRNNRKLNVDFVDLMYNPNSDQDIYVYPGDYIYIATAPFTEVYVLGNVAVPQRVRFDRGMRLMDALGSAGGWPMGFPYSADVSRVLVIRGCLECPLYVEVDLTKIYYGEMRDIVLQPGDIIYVYDKTLRFGRQMVLVALNAFVQAFATSAASYYGQFSWFHINFPGTSSD